MSEAGSACRAAAEAGKKSRNRVRTAVFGGSFNPIHAGHIAIGRAIIGQDEADEVWFMVSPQNPLKPQSELKDEALRLRLARKALQGERGMAASDFEFGLSRPSFTWNTLEALRQAYPDRSFSLVIGGDNWQNFSRWYRHDDILKAYPLIVYPRGDMPSLPPEGVRLVIAPLLPVSSTMIRERVGNGQSISGLVPDCILNDVEQAYR